MKDREEIKIWWEGPFKIEDILEDKIDKSYDIKANDKGLYQIYSTHPLYSNGVLVYIGRTKDKKGFQSRLKNRWVIKNGSDTKNVQIYLGKIFSDGVQHSDKETETSIDKSEVLLINAMKPAYNSSNIQNANEDFIDDNFILHNEGNFRNLYPVLDSKYFWQPYENFAIINKLAKLYAEKEYDEEDYYGFRIKGFKTTDNYTLWFGVQYEEWNESKIALELQIIPENENIETKIKKLNISEFKYKKFKSKEIENYFQIKFTNDFFELEDDKIAKTFESKINEVINLIKI